jgi:hypothetical protein
MNYYQLFKSVPSSSFMTTFLDCYGIRGFDDPSEFTKATLRERKTVDKLYDILPDMILYYIPCKASKYLSDLNEDRAITIMRQFLRLFEYKLSKRERVIDKKKIIYYSLQPLNQKSFSIHKVNDVISLV